MQASDAMGTPNNAGSPEDWAAVKGQCPDPPGWTRINEP